MSAKFLFLAFCPSRTLSQPQFPQTTVLAEGMLAEPGIWTVWAVTKSASMWLPKPCLVYPTVRALGIASGAVDNFWSPTSLHTHGIFHLSSKLLIASSVISSIIVKNTLTKIWKAFGISQIILKIFKSTHRESGLMPFPYLITFNWSFPW